MPRRPRVFVEGGIYHVYNRFARGAEIFAEPEEAIEFIEILRKARDRDSLRIYAWTLMSNHYCAYPQSSTTDRRFLSGTCGPLFRVRGGLGASRPSCRCGA